MYFPLTSSPQGLAMKLTYFQHPYEALTTPPSSDHVMSHDQEVGVSARVLVEKSTQHFILPIDPNLFRSLSLTLSHSLSLSHSLTHSLSHSHTHSHTHTLSLTPSLTHTLPTSLFHSLSLSLTLTRSLTHTHVYTLYTHLYFLQCKERRISTHHQ